MKLLVIFYQSASKQYTQYVQIVLPLKILTNSFVLLVMELLDYKVQTHVFAVTWYKLGHCCTFLLMSCFPSALVHYDHIAYTVYIHGKLLKHFK